MLLSTDDQTIIAQCTPQGKGAIALLRLSGPDAFAIAQGIARLASTKKITQLPTHTIHYGSVVDHDGTTIDDVLFLLMRAPKTFTGQDVVEISCHNNQFIIEAIIQRALAAGARFAQEGEFTKRAVLNNKIDLTQAEAINELIHAQTQMALKKSLAQLHGSFSAWIITVEKELTKALALSEASFEFIDEEMEFGPIIGQRLSQVLETITRVKVTFDQQLHIKQGVRIALIGSVNAGKSSLFNALLNKQRAIVTAIAGTTRDVIEAGLNVNGNYWTLVDTAGLRHTQDIIEQEGIRRSREEAHKADIILLVYDAARTLTQAEKEIYHELATTHARKVIPILNKADIATIPHANGIACSHSQPATIAQVKHALEEKVAHLFATLECPFLLNQRQFNLLLNLEQNVQTIATMLEQKPIRYELVSAHLTDALAHVSELTGKSISEAGMDAVFREFCVGK